MRLITNNDAEAIEYSRLLTKIAYSIRDSSIPRIIKTSYIDILCQIRDSISTQKEFYSPGEFEAEFKKPLPPGVPVYCRGLGGAAFIDLAAGWEIMSHENAEAMGYAHIVFCTGINIPPSYWGIPSEEQADE